MEKEVVDNIRWPFRSSCKDGM